LALEDLEAVHRIRGYLLELEIATQEFRAQAAVAGHEVLGIRTHARTTFERIQSLVAWPEEPSKEWDRGFLAGIFDAEGTCSRGILKILNLDEKFMEATARCLRRFGFDYVVERSSPGDARSGVRLLGSFYDYARFFQITQIAISRKRDLAGMALRSDLSLRVVSVEALAVEVPMFDITTGTGDFIASGVVSHNCYARPTHEYLGFGAGTDFDRKITVKMRAAERLRERLAHPTWKGEVITFSGVTDCYQPLEASYRLTRACLKVCRDYRNPVAIITKAPLIERDLDILCELHELASAAVTLSIPLWDQDRARAFEPFVATPERRLRTVEKLARSGIEVGVNIAPLIPGIGEEEVPKILEAAAAAGAVSAGYVLLRLPGSVKAVFEERLRSTMPMRAKRILARIRETRNGALYDSRFGSRQRGEGEYARAIEALFSAAAARAGLLRSETRAPRRSTFRRPEDRKVQLRLL
jgi:DNA repair photolyase